MELITNIPCRNPESDAVVQKMKNTLLLAHALKSSRALLLAAVTILVGCGQELPDYHQDLVSVSGNVTFDNNPVEGAIVTFVAKSGPSRTSSATTNAQGEYSMATPPAGDGVLPGSYDVVISKLVMPDGSPIPPDTAPMDVGAEELLPHRYSSFASPSLNAEVSGEGGSFTFELDSK